MSEVQPPEIKAARHAATADTPRAQLKLIRRVTN
jgi:hypothetical protein